jgi:integrase
VSLYAGIRQGERLGATLDSVDFDRGEFTVRWNLVEANYEHGCGGTCGRKHPGHCPDKRLVIPEGMQHRHLRDRYILVPPKSGESRTFPLPASLLAELERDIAALGPNPHGLLWPALDGSPMTSRADQAEWKALLERAKVKRIGATTHWARHTAITDFAAVGVADRVIGAMVGHKSPGVTGRYVHVSSSDEAAAMQKLGERRQLGSDPHPS